MKIETNPCCEIWAKAHEQGTASEGYEWLVDYEGNEPHIGNGLPPVRFCPWCGSAKGASK